MGGVCRLPVAKLFAVSRVCCGGGCQDLMMVITACKQVGKKASDDGC